MSPSDGSQSSVSSKRVGNSSESSASSTAPSSPPTSPPSSPSPRKKIPCWYFQDAEENPQELVRLFHRERATLRILENEVIFSLLFFLFSPQRRSFLLILTTINPCLSFHFPFALSLLFLILLLMKTARCYLRGNL